MHLARFELASSPPEGDVLSIRLQVQMNSCTILPYMLESGNTIFCIKSSLLPKLNFYCVFDIMG